MIKVFKNNNLHIKFEKDDSGNEAIEKLFLNYDLVPVSDEYCISNFAMAADWSYNGGWNYYRITSLDLVALEEGKTVILKPLDEEYINEYILNEEF